MTTRYVMTSAGDLGVGALTKKREHRFIISTSMATVLTLTGLTPSSAYYGAFVDEPVPPGKVLITVNEGVTSYSIRKAIQLTKAFGGEYGATYHCPTFTGEQPNCDVNQKHFEFRSTGLLPLCDAPIIENCVESLSFLDESGSRRAAEFLGNAPGPSYSSVPKLGLNDARTALKFRIQGLTHSGGQDTYALMAIETQTYSPLKSKFLTEGVGLSIVPFVEKFGSYSPVRIEEFRDQNGNTQVGESGSGALCIWSDFNICAESASFIGAPKLEVSLRYSSHVQGWFHGRLTDQSLKVEKVTSGNQRVKITGRPVNVPRFAVFASEAGTSEYVMKLFSAGKKTTWEEFGESGSKFVFSTDGWQDIPYRLLEEFREEVQDSAFSVSSLWSLSSVNTWRPNQCFSEAGGLIGMVTTNATVYEGLEPRFEDGSLSYKVAGLHFEPDGSQVNLGTYDLTIRSDVARCLYGFSRAPIGASLQVVGDGGDQNISTTVVTENNGWLKLAAYGFTFSEKEIKVKLTQPYSKTLTRFAGATKTLTLKQKTEIKATVAKATNNPKFICTGTYVSPSSKSTALARARAACNYAKSLDKKHSYFAQAKQTASNSYDAKVMITSK